MMKKENAMLRVIREFRSVSTPEEFRNEIIGGAMFVVLFPILFAGLWIMTP